MTFMCARLTPIPAHICSSLPVACDFCPPVIPVVELSDIMIVTREFLTTASSNPVIPECVKVESPITAIDGNNPASDAPIAMVTEAPISTHELIALYGGSAARV